MAKFYGSATKTGKVGGSVFSIRNGVVIERQYQPIVNNPSTDAQVAARAKMKLMSQLSAVLGPYIAIPRVRNISSRNLFVKKNYGLSSYSNNTASVDLNNVQLTTSVVGLPEVRVTRDSDTISVNIFGVTGLANLSRVVYVAFVKLPDNRLRFYESKVVSDAGVQGNFVTTLVGTSYSLVVYAYGVRDNTESARVVFGSLESPTAEQVANLITQRVLLESDITLTETRGATLAAAGA